MTAKSQEYRVLVSTGHPDKNEFLKEVDGVMTIVAGEYDRFFSEEAAHAWVNIFSSKEIFSQFHFIVEPCYGG